MDCVSRLVEYRSLVREIRISGYEHLKIISQNPSNHLKKAYEYKNIISSDYKISDEQREEFLKEINENIEKIEQEINKSNEKSEGNISLLTHLVAAGVGYHLGYNKKSDEINEKQQFMSDAFVALKDELKKYL